MSGAGGSPDDVDLAVLRRRRSLKWRRYPDDVLPLWVAETDFDLAEPIAAALADMVARSDTGYVDGTGLAEAFAGLAARRWSWEVDPSRALLVPDATRGVMSALEVLTDPGDAVVVETPAYPPFFWAVPQVGRRVAEVPYVEQGNRLSPDLDGIAAALAAGARAILLCSPHNPTGLVHERSHLEALAGLAEHYDVPVLADEVHGLLTQPSASFVPFGVVAAGRPGVVSVSMSSASKAFNLAGLKTALLLAHDQRSARALKAVPAEYAYGASVLGPVAGVAAFTEGEDWLDATVARIGRAQRALAGELAERLPDVRWTPPDATYLAWLDCRALGLGDDPAAVFLERGRVALASGPDFGAPGRGFARLNLGTGPNVLGAAVARMAAVLEGS